MDFSAYTRFHALAQDRRSCRNFQSEPIDRSLLLAVLDAARLAPSAVNRQPVRYMVLDAQNDPEARDIILKVYNRPWIATAPVYVIAIGLHDTAWHRPCDGKDHTDIDAAIAVEHICLAAAALGLGSCWVCNFDAPELHKLLDLGESEEPIAIVPLGYPADENAPRRGRKSLDEIVQWGRKA
ncbi:MAG: nitroreductase family protein [Muribaculaceae bacterium]|nr:nitroreductase family protein [Muribaculaceae bacterium]